MKKLFYDGFSVVYIGGTGCKLTIRVNVHIDAFENDQKSKSVFADHLVGYSRNFLKKSVELLCIETSNSESVAHWNMRIIRN